MQKWRVLNHVDGHLDIVWVTPWALKRSQTKFDYDSYPLDVKAMVLVWLLQCSFSFVISIQIRWIYYDFYDIRQEVRIWVKGINVLVIGYIGEKGLFWVLDVKKML